MSRLRELIFELKSTFPDDWYAVNFEGTLTENPAARSLVASYDRALKTLDAESWKTLRDKAIRCFPNDARNRGKLPFFNQLNEAFAFRFLVQRGYKKIGFVPEDNSRRQNQEKTPDIGFERNNGRAFCEVKTLSVSVDEIARSISGDSFDASIYRHLDEPFLKKKLPDAIKKALGQIRSAGNDGVVFIVIQFDDFTLNNYSTYRQQIESVLTSQFPTEEVYVKMGIQGQRHLHYRPLRIAAKMPNPPFHQIADGRAELER